MLAFVPGTRASARQSLLHQYFEGVCSSDSTSKGIGLLQLSNSSSSGTDNTTKSLSSSDRLESTSSYERSGNVPTVSIARSGNCVEPIPGLGVCNPASVGETSDGGASAMMVCDEQRIPLSVTHGEGQEPSDEYRRVCESSNDENNPNSSNIGNSGSSTVVLKTLNPLTSTTSTTAASVTASALGSNNTSSNNTNVSSS